MKHQCLAIFDTLAWVMMMMMTLQRFFLVAIGRLREEAGHSNPNSLQTVGSFVVLRNSHHYHRHHIRPLCRQTAKSLIPRDIFSASGHLWVVVTRKLTTTTTMMTTSATTTMSETAMFYYETSYGAIEAVLLDCTIVWQKIQQYPCSSRVFLVMVIVVATKEKNKLTTNNNNKLPRVRGSSDGSNTGTCLSSKLQARRRARWLFCYF